MALLIAAVAAQAGANGVMATCAGLLGQALVAGPQSGFSGAVVDTRALNFPPLQLCFLGFAAAIVKTGAGAFSVYGQKRAVFEAGNAVRHEITDAILRCGQPPSAAADTNAALVVRLREVERGIDEGVFAGLRAGANLVPLVIALVVLSSSLAFAALGVLVPFALALAFVRRRFRRGHARATRLAEELHSGVDELVRHLDLWRTYGAGDRVQRALAAAGDEAARASARADAGRTALSGANEALAAGSLLVAVALVERGGLALGRGSLVAFAAVFFLMYRPLRDLGDARTAVERGADALGALDRVRGDLEVRSAHLRIRASGADDASTSRTYGWDAQRLVVRGLSVARGGWSTPVTDLHAEPGEIVALVGPTGSGKTTLLRALLGLEPDAQGTVHYGDRDLSAAGVGPRERPFAWVPQEAAVISGTLADNVTLGAPAPLESAAQSTLQSLGAQSLLDRAGEARLHAGGPELSGGERQWVAIARALASGLPVLLLDEPTSGLDADSQDRVLATLATLRGRRTVIVVTHRPEPLAIADRVVRLGSLSVIDALQPPQQPGPSGL
jgi:ABC-type multidrug transport system fused ATPase/permease subunit